MNQLARLAFAVNQANLAVGCDVFQADGATFVRNRDFARVRDANFVTHVEAESQADIERLLRRVEIEFADLNFRIFRLNFETPPAFEARLLLDGFEHGRNDLIMTLDGPLPEQRGAIEIKPIQDRADWKAYAEMKQIAFGEYQRQVGTNEDPAIVAQLVKLSVAKAPPVRYWMAYVEGIASGFFSSYVPSLPGLGEIGQVEDLFVHPAFRHRGIATALVERCVADCREQGAEQVMLVCDPGDTPKQMYAAMGFQPVALQRAYRKFL